MSRNLYILAATIGLFALISIAIGSFGVTNSAGDRSLWTTMGLALLVVALLVALSAVLSSLFEQAERRAEDQRLRRNRRLRP